MIEFVITATTPDVLISHEAPPLHLKLAEYSNITEGGITIVMENISDFDLKIYVYIGSIIQDGSWLSEKEDYFWPDYGTWEWDVIRGNSKIELDLDWSLSHGELPPGQYDLIIITYGNAPPPHPTGAFQEVAEISFILQ